MDIQNISVNLVIMNYEKFYFDNKERWNQFSEMVLLPTKQMLKNWRGQMKALNYLEVKSITNKKEFDDIVDVIREFEGRVSAVTDIEKFYSQPFNPELIIKLFDGWKINQIMGGWFNNNGYFIEYIIDGNNRSYQIISMLKLRRDNIDLTTNQIPRTLDDFINDCQRAGIQLEWRTK